VVWHKFLSIKSVQGSKFKKQFMVDSL